MYIYVIAIGDITSTYKGLHNNKSAVTLLIKMALEVWLHHMISNFMQARIVFMKYKALVERYRSKLYTINDRIHSG